MYVLVYVDVYVYIRDCACVRCVCVFVYVCVCVCVVCVCVVCVCVVCVCVVCVCASGGRDMCCVCFVPTKIARQFYIYYLYHHILTRSLCISSPLTPPPTPPFTPHQQSPSPYSGDLRTGSSDFTFCFDWIQDWFLTRS